MKLFTKLAAAVVLATTLCAANVASAAIITWTLNGVTFDDGGTASGYFDYDTVTGQANTFDIQTTAGTTLVSFHYTTSNAFAYSNLFPSNSLAWVTNGSTRYINLAFASSLSAPGVVNLRPGDLASNFGLTGSWECDNCSNIRDITGGSVTSGAVPEPATWALMIGGFGLAGAALRRRRTLVAA